MPNKVLVFKVERCGRLSDLLKGMFTRGRITALKKNGAIEVNGSLVHTDYLVKSGDMLKLTFDAEASGYFLPQLLDVDILYEDEDVMAVYKGRGIACMPSAAHPNGHLLNGLKALRPDDRFHIVTRLDKDTVGTVLLCRSALARSRIEITEKRYLAVVKGRVTQPFEIDLPIGRAAGIERRGGCGQAALTRIRPRRTGAYSLVEAIPVTGRTHQLRVHLAAAGYPICGDTLYGGAVGNYNAGQLLGCISVRFIHPFGAETNVYCRRAENEITAAAAKLNE